MLSEFRAEGRLFPLLARVHAQLAVSSVYILYAKLIQCTHEGAL